MILGAFELSCGDLAHHERLPIVLYMFFIAIYIS